MSDWRKYKHANEQYHLNPNNHLDRLIFKYHAKPTTSTEIKTEFEEYLLMGKVVPDSKSGYVAIRDDKKAYGRTRRQAVRKGIIFKLAIPLQVQEEVEDLKNKMLPLTNRLAFQANNEGWLYIYTDNTTCFYVGKTKDRYPLYRAASHLCQKQSPKWSEYSQKNEKHYNGWYMKFIRPEDCDQLIRKSFFMPGENYEALMPNLEEAYQEKQREPFWLLHRAEWVLITILKPKFNSTLKPYQLEQG